MTAEQIQAMVKGIVEASGGPAWWFYAILVLCAGAAAYLGTYFGEKGKNLATKEDIEVITAKVESVKQTLASRGWVRQQHWANREKHYMELLKHLSLLKVHYADLLEHFPDGWTSGFPGNETRDAHYQKHFDGTVTAKFAVRTLTGPAAVFLSEETINTIGRMWGNAEVLENNAINTEDFLQSWISNARDAYQAVLAEAKNALEAADA